ncbi:vWA domain-containing protein [Kiritimatiella glycovorans]|uniref:von Willebrand factor type A domain protein n=1 Tax=Kiritimatiella glycovorans TaxID=1307763 RepID=A0A0G3EJB1_9BACT|nr:VWA domain-containing protein [Kiritimatiella glycovorans]AKJ64269.1 von Willebrand factor type A domain protein [Kiritimatiella glycovorans]
MIFHEPRMLLLLLLLPPLGWLMRRAAHRNRLAAEQLRGANDERPSAPRRRRWRLASFAALITALAAPAWNPRPGPGAETGRHLVLALDISRSMLAEDLFPSRLESARIAIHEALPSLQGRRVGLITFAGSAAVRVPLTRDHHFVQYMLKRAAPSDAEIGGTTLQAAIEKSIDLMIPEGEENRTDVVFFTDGEDHGSDLDATAKQLADCGARVLMIGLGDPELGARVPDPSSTNEWMRHEGRIVVSRLEEETLHRLARISPHVEYFPARTSPFDLRSVYTRFTAEAPPGPAAEEGAVVYTEGRPWLIAAALLCWWLAAGAPLRYRTVRLLLLLLCIAGCSPENREPEGEYARRMERGNTLWRRAQREIREDPAVALATLEAGREAFLRAALLRPGDRPAARRIAGVSAQIREVKRALPPGEPESTARDPDRDAAQRPGPGEFEEEYGEGDPGAENVAPSQRSIPMSAESLRVALENRRLPEPDYSASEILAEEAENQKERAERRGRRASGVNKNW